MTQTSDRVAQPLPGAPTVQKTSGGATRSGPPAGHRRFRRALPVLLLLACFLGVSALWALRVPVPTLPPDEWSYFNPDAWSHLAVIRYLATHHRLPPFTYQYNASVHPPLYHALAALVYGPITAIAGHAGAVLALRLLSCLMGTAVVWLAYRTARLLLSRPAALLAAGCVAGVPMFVSLSGAVNNENLATLAAAASVYLLILGLCRGFTARRVLALSFWVAVGIGTKLTCLGLLPAALLALWLAGRPRRIPAPTLAGQMLLVLGGTALLTGWWFARNLLLYGDPLRHSVERPMWEALAPGYGHYRATAGIAPTGYLVWIAFDGWTSFWGRFDATRLFLHERAYLFFALLRIAGATGLLLLWARGRLRRPHLAAGGVLAALGLFSIAGFCWYNWVYYSPQGRNLFPLLVPLGLVTAAGWRALFPRGLQGVMSALVLAALLALNLHAALTAPANRVRGSNIPQPPGFWREDCPPRFGRNGRHIPKRQHARPGGAALPPRVRKSPPRQP